MEYIVLGKDNKEYGPVDAETLQKWVEHGRVFKDTKIRNSLMKKWNDAGSMEFLHEAFSVQDVKEEEEEGVTGKVMGIFGISSKKHELKKFEEKDTAFRQKYIPSPANALQRIGAFIVDAVLISVYGLLLFFTMVIYTGTWVDVQANVAGDLSALLEETSSEVADSAGYAEKVTSTESTAKPAAAPAAKKETVKEEAAKKEDVKKEAKPPAPAEPVVFPVPATMHRTFYFFFTIFVASILIYYGIGLGVYAQTIGMWFWGIIIVKGHADEVFPARAFAFTLLMFLIGPLAPVVVLLNPQHRSIHGYLTGTRLIKVTAQAKA